MNINNFKDIAIGSLIHQRVLENDIDIQRICNFLSCTEQEVEKMYKQKSLDSLILLKWSKLLKYDFFRIYSQHIILYSPQANSDYNNLSAEKHSSLPQFRKNIYTREIINFIIELVESGEKTKSQIIQEYNIPKTTLYKWIYKYKTSNIPDR